MKELPSLLHRMCEINDSLFLGIDTASRVASTLYKGKQLPQKNNFDNKISPFSFNESPPE